MPDGTQAGSAPAEHWHALETDRALEAVGADPGGLSSKEAAERLERFGPNKLPEAPKPSALRRFLAQFNNLLIYVLLGAGVITLFLGHVVDACVIFAVVIGNAAIGFIQEGKAEAALDSIREMLSPTAAVVRDGRRTSVPAEELVPGDVVALESGDRVPADLRLIDVAGLKVEEAALTGESAPVEKSASPVDADAGIGDRASMAFSGTLTTYGQARGLVVATGRHTEIGKISGLLSETTKLTSPLIATINRFAKTLTVAILTLCAAVFLFGYFVRGYGFAEIFMAVVGVAVAAIPEGLPAVLTITLALGAQAMAKRNAIVRKLPAIETLGSVSVICSDKTGTLTRNEMTAATVALAGGDLGVSGAGYAPKGGFFEGDPGEGAEIDPADRADLLELATAAVLANDAEVARQGADGEGKGDVARQVDGDASSWRVDGDPMEGALWALGAKAGLDPDGLRRERPRAGVIPFDARHRFMATLHADGKGAVAYVKGAPDRLLAMCDAERHGTEERPIDRAAWEDRLEAIADQGQRVLAFAAKRFEGSKRGLGFDDVEHGLTLLGLVGLEDPPRDEAALAVEECRSAGIRVKMITGDHATTAAAIARRLRLSEDPEGRTLTGAQLARLEGEEFAGSAEGVDVFARTSPEDKLRLVEALQAKDAVIAMTGDGVNDSPALKRADIGVSMGMRGSGAAKEASDIVLADDNFATIAAAVREGRRVYDNLKKSILFLLPTNGGQALVLVAAVLLGITLPITPVQVLWINMVIAVTLGVALAFEPAEPDVMARPPKPKSEPLLSKPLFARLAFVSALFLCGTLAAFWWETSSGSDTATARTVAVNTLVAMQVFYLFNARRLRPIRFEKGDWTFTKAIGLSVAAVAALQLLFTYAPFMNALFDSVPLALPGWGVALAIGLAVFVLVEAEKRVSAKLRGQRHPRGAAGSEPGKAERAVAGR